MVQNVERYSMLLMDGDRWDVDATGLGTESTRLHNFFGFDGGEYAKLVSMEDFDIHTHNAKLFGIYDGKEEITKSTRELAKRLIYSVLYGGGPYRVGSILDPSLSERKQKEIGYETIDTFYKNLPAIKKLKDKVDEKGYTKRIPDWY